MYLGLMELISFTNFSVVAGFGVMVAIFLRKLVDVFRLRVSCC